MSEPKQNSYMTVDDYLRREESGTVRYEFAHGRIFSMTGSSDAHNIISGNLFAKIHAHLEGSGCKAYTNNMKVRIEAADAFYYPDIMVTCETVDPKSVFKRSPRLIIEVLSPSTNQIDRREKLVAYQQIDSLKEYAIVHQSRKLIELHRREAILEWTLSLIQADDVLCFQSMPNGPFEIPLSVIYGGLDFPTRVQEDAEEYELA